MIPTAADWDRWLNDWNGLLLSRHDPSQFDAFVDPRVTPAVVSTGWLGFPPAPEAEVAALERRLDVPLPPSYRSFLLASNGFLQPGVLVPRLFACDEVRWLRDSEPETIDQWRPEASGAGAGSNDDGDFVHYLPTALQVSARETIGTAMYLLNPQVVDGDGEWEAFLFAHWVPGVARYPSFWALMQQERANLLAPPPPPPPGRLRTFMDAVRWIFRSPSE